MNCENLLCTSKAKGYIFQRPFLPPESEVKTISDYSQSVGNMAIGEQEGKFLLLFLQSITLSHSKIVIVPMENHKIMSLSGEQKSLQKF